MESAIGLHPDALSAHRLRSEFPRYESLRALSPLTPSLARRVPYPHSLCDVLAVLLSVVAIDLCALTHARVYELALSVFFVLTRSR